MENGFEKESRFISVFGKYDANTDREPVRSRPPIPINKIPLPLSIQPIQRLILLKNEMKRSIANADMINGIASPAEYAIRREVPAPQLELVAAIVKIAAKIGPMQGVHPAPNAIPTNNEPMFLVERF